MDLQEVREWVLKKKEILIIVGSVFAFLLMLVIGINMRSEQESKKATANVIYLKKPLAKKNSPKNPAQPQDSQTSQSSNKQNTENQFTSKAYFTEISPEDILKRIQEYGEIKAMPDDYQVNNLPVGWVVYFFGTGERREHFIDVQFDTLETGFGASIVSEVDISLYPEFLKMEMGQKVWMAGTIEGVNPDGTGTFFVKADLFSLTGEPPVEQVVE